MWIHNLSTINYKVHHSVHRFNINCGIKYSKQRDKVFILEPATLIRNISIPNSQKMDYVYKLFDILECFVYAK